MTMRWTTALAVLTLALASAGRLSAEPPVRAAPPRGPEHTVVVVDLSGSVNAQEIVRQRQLVAALVGGLSYGDKLVVMTAAASGRRQGVAPVVAEMPPARNPLRPLTHELTALQVAKRVAAQSADRVFTQTRANRTDLFATLHDAADQLFESPKPRRSLVMLSDMLQCAGEICMEGNRPIPQGWVERARASGTIPNLRNVCVSAVGPDPSTARGVQVRSFWISYFAAAGARFDPARYRYMVPQPGMLRCA